MASGLLHGWCCPAFCAPDVQRGMMAPSFLSDLWAGLGSAGLVEFFLQLLEACAASAFYFPGTVSQE